MPQLYTVTAFWDADAGVWVAYSEDVPGLAAEADTMEALILKLKIMVPELPVPGRQPPADTRPSKMPPDSDKPRDEPMSRAFDAIAAGLNDALAYTRGDTAGSRTY